MSQFPRNVRPVLIALVALAIGLPAAMVIGGVDARTTVGEDIDAEIRGLLEKRLQLMDQVVKEVEQQYESGMAPLDVVLAAREAHGRAELELCSTAAERVKVHEKLAALARDAEKLITQQVAAGTTSTTDALRAKVKRIEAEIALLRAKKSAKNE